MLNSIIITTFNRPQLLKFGLQSLAKQGFVDTEIIVLNDGNPNDGTDQVCNESGLDIKYFAAKHNAGWRCPSYAINFGVKQAKGKNIFISCAEIYHMGSTIAQMEQILNNKEVLLTPNIGKDDNGSILNLLNNNKEISNNDIKLLPKLNIQLPFFMGLHKSLFEAIGGYDEDFIGMGYDDNDFVDRILMTGTQLKTVSSSIVHIYHERLAFDTPEIKQKFNYNQHLYQTRKNIIRNKDGWGNKF